MLNKSQQYALKKLVNDFKKHNVPYLIDGGLAAIAWGSKRQLVDIDVVVPKANMKEVRDLWEEYIKHDTQNYKSEHWDIWQTSFEIDGVNIEVCQAEDFYTCSNGEKKLLNPDISRAIPKEVSGIDINVIPKDELIILKEFLGREVDLADLKYLQ